jgi:hypothetical protein
MSNEKKVGGNHPPPIETRFKPGQSGNPGGQAKGTRNKLNAAFLNALAKDFQTHGEDAIRQCREENPGAYVKVLAALLPKEIELKRPLEEFEDDELIAAVGALQSFLAAREDEAGAGDAAQLPPTH